MTTRFGPAHATMSAVGLFAALVLGLTSCEDQAPAATPPTTPALSATDQTTSASPSDVPSTPTAAPSPAPEELLVAYLFDGSLEGAEATATAPYQAAELAFGAATGDGTVPAPVRLVAFDLGAGPERVVEAVSEIASDPAYVAGIVAPRLVAQASIVERLEVPVVSLAPRDRVEGEAPGTWLRLVPPVEVLGRAAGAWAAELAEGRTCPSPAAQDGSRFARAAAAAVGDLLEVTDPVAPADVSASGCDAVIWSGDTDGGIELVSGLGRPRPLVVGGPDLRDPRFVREAGAAANGTLAVCGCADVSTSLSLRAQRFVQVFQAEYGLPPGPGAVEAWDAAHLLIRALSTPASGAGPDDALSRVRRFEGLGGTYRLGPDGELANPGPRVSRYRVEGGRWVPIAGDA